jgi:hypothetical protein
MVALQPPEPTARLSREVTLQVRVTRGLLALGGFVSTRSLLTLSSRQPLSMWYSMCLTGTASTWLPIRS